MKACVIVPTVRKLKDLRLYLVNFGKYMHFPDILVIDENDRNRDENKRLVPNAEFYGVKERREWFRERGLEKFIEVIPKRSHAETSFGLLIAYERNYDMILFIDDDTFPLPGDFLGEHWNNLEDMSPLLPAHKKWVKATDYYPRGYPYSERTVQTISAMKGPSEIVLNQGLWSGVPDMSAIDLLFYGGVDGTLVLTSPVKNSYTIPIGAYTPVCSMNLSFKPEIIPAFYQTYQGASVGDVFVDRFDDIWSGIFLKKVLDTLDKGMSVGRPFCFHDKAPRNVFDDVKAELDGIELNEVLWKIVDGCQLESAVDYTDAYRKLINELKGRLSEFGRFKKYMEFQLDKMSLWLDLIDRLGD